LPMMPIMESSAESLERGPSWTVDWAVTQIASCALVLL